ncbi:MAG: DUF1800 domain-containing protein, partial [Pseudomonadota bacterium]
FPSMVIEGKTRGLSLGDAQFEAEAVRAHLGGSFAEMLRAAVAHPVMLEYLDQTRSFGPNSLVGRQRGRGLNENLAREVLELHTLGVDGGYTQDDVRELAEALTGFVTREGVFQFHPGAAEPGAETVLGQSYGGGDPDPGHAFAILDDLAHHPTTARHIARKLATHFVADVPDTALVDHIAARFAATGGDLPSVHAALIEHPAAWEGFGAKIKQPWEVVVSTFRAFGIDAETLDGGRPRALRGMARALGSMGQPLRDPGGPNGWPEAAEAWITPQGLAARIDWARTSAARLGGEMDPRRFLETALADAASVELGFAVGAAETAEEGIFLTLAAPEFHRR